SLRSTASLRPPPPPGRRPTPAAPPPPPAAAPAPPPPPGRSRAPFAFRGDGIGRLVIVVEFLAAVSVERRLHVRAGLAPCRIRGAYFLLLASAAAALAALGLGGFLGQAAGFCAVHGSLLAVTGFLAAILDLDLLARRAAPFARSAGGLLLAPAPSLLPAFPVPARPPLSPLLLRDLWLLFLLFFGKGQVRRPEGDRGLLRLLRRRDRTLAADPLDLLLGTVQAGCRDDLDLQVEFLLEARQLLAIVVLHGVRELGVETDAHPLDRAGGGLRLDPADQAQAHHLLAGQPAEAAAGGAGTMRAQLQRLLDALPVDLQETVRADPADRGPRLVDLHGVLESLLDLALVLRRAHVDEIHHHEAADVAQPELARNLPGRLQVGVDRGLF